MTPTPLQREVADFQKNQSVFLRGNASCGKSTAGLLRLQNILHASEKGVSVSVLVLVPQRSLAIPYQQFLSDQRTAATDQVSVQTMSGLVKRMVDLFWPLIGSLGFFQHPFEDPRFLTLETSQYYMSKIVRPMLDEGKFSTIGLPLFRLCSQLVDNLNKSALVGFPYTEIGARLSSAWIGDATRQNVYSDVQEAVSKFRKFCQANNLVDFSLQVELFQKHLWSNESFQKYIQHQFQHLIYDNSEEDPPFVHDCLIDWLPSFKSSLVIWDEQGGYRSFLGADPQSALRLEKSSKLSFTYQQNFISSPALMELSDCLENLNDCQLDQGLISETLTFQKDRIRFFPDLLESMADQVAALLKSGEVQPNDIAILSPFVSDSLQFTLENDLARRGIKLSIQKPSMPLTQNATIRTLITFAKLAHPDWQMPADYHAVASSLTYAIGGLDLIRAHLLLGGLKAEDLDLKNLPPPENSEVRVPIELIEKFHILRNWLGSVDKDEPLDNFISRLFGEVLSQPGFQFHGNVEAGTSTAVLMESYRKFGHAFRTEGSSSQFERGMAFVEALEAGMIPAMYLSEWEGSEPESVLLAPVTSFLMRNEPVRYQFWLNAGSKGWYERLEQPLTHPIVLSRAWTAGKQWSADEELHYNQMNLKKVIAGLIARCQDRIYLFTSDYNEAGVEERGQLLSLFQNLLHKARQANDD